ncbi:7-methylguanosine phosphate-specific 5'-nucleotidase isoform X2 [Dendroctonus ponderosae]|uniref:5'-nucleotidase n=1 Tax=Dendroctonus ponderosae TaxID=77166 RepID=A0AAR5P8Z3_DENPD|nr:7-methylguanosine phosphate-specific 5'-nucleotidase isoform X2 [Dendroctonus ponderosae]
MQTRAHSNVKQLQTMFSRIRSAAEDETYQATVKKLRQKYYPIELDPHIPVKDKIKHMEDWWNLSEKAISGLMVTQQDIDDVCLECKPSLRNGCKEFFRDLNDSNVPALVFSAGCGDIVAAVLKHAGVYLPNVKVISNFLKFNEDGTIMGFKDKIIHVFNKNEYAVKNTDFYGEVADRENAIVLGDSLGDAAMTQGMEHCQNALKIGFLYEQIEDSLPQYLDTFDIVLVDDQTMDVPRAIFDYIRDAAR